MFNIIYLVYKIIENHIDCQIVFDSDIIKFNFKKNANEYLDRLKSLYIELNITKEFYFYKDKITFAKFDHEEIIFNTVDNDDINDEEEKINLSNWFYKICWQILETKTINNDKIKLLEIFKDVRDNKIRIIDQISNELQNEIKEDKRAYRITNLISNPKEDINSREENLIMKIWHLVLFYSDDKLESITPFYCLPFEKELLHGIKNLYKIIDIRMVSKIISFTKNFLELKNVGISYGNSDSFLYKIQAGFFNYSDVDDKDKKNFCSQIYNEIKCYNKLKFPIEKIWSKENSISCLNNQYYNLKEYIENAVKQKNIEIN